MNIRSMGFAALFVTLASPILAENPQMTVYKDPYCGCCTAWAELAEGAGYDVKVIESPDISTIKVQAGIPDKLWSCHTVEINGYYIEGHVPLDTLARLLKERPEISGIAVPGMPAGSPGMGDDPNARYDVMAWGGTAGEGEVFQKVGGR